MIRLHKLRKVLLTLLFTVTICSCSETVDVPLPNDKINRQDIYEDILTTKSALTYLYSRLRDTQIFNSSSTGLAYNLSLLTDEVLSNSNQSDLFFSNNISTNNPSYTESWWNESYKDIYSINAFLEGLKSSSSIKSSIKNSLLGEAYALRALYYQTLCKLFGDIPYIVTTNYITNTNIGKTKYEEVLHLIEKDLLQATDLLDYTYRSPERIQINKAFVEMLLSENYLLQKRYDKAEFFAEKIISNPLYQLETNFDKIFRKDASSTILQISPQSLPSPTNQASLYLFTFANAYPSLSSDLYNSFTSNDVRKLKWIKVETINNNTYLQPYKYKNIQNNTEEYTVFFRLEEAYFYLAEALANQEKTLEAAQILNNIRVKRGLQLLPLNLSKGTFIKELLKEANKEFFTEGGHRFFDLKRNGKLQDLSQTKSTWKTHNELLPIPEKQILINKNLLPNNPGY